MERLRPRTAAGVATGLLLGLAATSLAAQHHDHAGAPAAATGASPAAPSPAATPAVPAFPSAFEGYRPFRADEPLRDWRAVNDEAGRLGGHVGQTAPQPAGGAAGQPGHQHGGAVR